MHYQISDARYVAGFTLWLKFRDGCKGEIDLEEELDGPIFEPLRSLEFFRQFSLHPELHTLVWPNGAEFSPEYLYARVRETIAA